MELPGEGGDYKEPFLSGYFRDQKRRIDMVLVSKDSDLASLEVMKMTFLMNAINIGMDVEIEAGISSKCLDLTFIKLHAPETILQRYSMFYQLKKVFKSSHMELIRCGITEEKELVKIIQRWYPTKMFSTYERSLIVFKALNSVTFGHPENWVGAKQLVDHNIFLDMYPLHDGPKHLVRGQTVLQMNGRQALYYSWCGYKNLFRQMPLHLIREYLGERVAFFFAFYQFYNSLLFFLGVIGLLVFNQTYDIQGRHIKIEEFGKNKLYVESCKTWHTDLEIWPRCRDFVACPFRQMLHLRRELLCKVYLDNPYVYYMAFFTVLFGILLSLVWKRFENYWYWMWETNEEDAKSLTRSEFRKVARRHNWEVVYRRPLEFLILLVSLFAVVLLYPGLMLEVYLKMLNGLRVVEEYGRALYPSSLKNHKTIDPKVGFRAIERINHFVLVIIGSLNAILIMGMEMGWCYVAKLLHYAYEPRSEWQYEKRYIYSTFTIVTLINIGVVSFYAHIKGALFTNPVKNAQWDFPLQLGMLHCGLLYCIDEVFLVYVTTFKTKLFYTQVMRSLTRLPTDKQINPDDFVPPKYEIAPCWEREFDLLPVNEEKVFDLYLKLFVQIAVVTFFASVFPLAPLIAFVWNLWNMGYLAKLMVVHSRRPLVLQTWGLGPWHDVLFILPFVACFTNAIYVVRNNSFLDRRFNKRYWGHRQKRRFLIDYYMSYGLRTHFSNESKKYYMKYNESYPDFFKDMGCYLFPGQYNYAYKIKPVTFTPMAGHWAILWRKYLFVLLFWMLSSTLYYLLMHWIGPVSTKVRTMRRMEEAVREYGMKRIPVRKNKTKAKKTRVKTKQP